MTEKKYKIHEVAEYLDLTPATIRHYEEKGFIHVDKDPENGYRMFTDKDIYKLWSIAYHRSFDMTLNEIDLLKHSRTFEETLNTVSSHREKTYKILEEALQTLKLCDHYTRFFERARRIDMPPTIIRDRTFYFFSREDVLKRTEPSFPACTFGSIFQGNNEMKYSVVDKESMELLPPSARNCYQKKVTIQNAVSIIITSEQFFHLEPVLKSAVSLAEKEGFSVCDPYYIIYLLSAGDFDNLIRYYEVILTLR